MKVREFYQRVYDMIGDATPLSTDCGKLCGSKCCEETDAGEGMYLFPREERLYRPHMADNSFKIYPTDLYTDLSHCVYLYTCRGHCDRALRPLGCRIFPLVPYKKPGGTLSVILDPRGAQGLCPLAAGDIRELNEDFVRAVTRAMQFAVKNNEVCRFIEVQTVELLEPLLEKSAKNL